MSNLYILLIVIGVLIIVAVLAYNWWQERKFNQQVDSGFSALQKDALLDDPEVDSNQMKSGFEDTIIDDFAIKHQKSVAEYQPASQPTPQYQTQASPNANNPLENSIADQILPDDVSINDAFSELTNALKGTQTRKVEPTFNAENLASTANHVNTPEKPVQRSDIKAIFDDAFGKTNKAPSANIGNTAPEQKKPTYRQYCQRN